MSFVHNYIHVSLVSIHAESHQLPSVLWLLDMLLDRFLVDLFMGRFLIELFVFLVRLVPLLYQLRVRLFCLSAEHLNGA